MIRALAIGVLWASLGVCLASEKPTVIVVVGAEGAEEFGPPFRAWSERWQQAAAKAQADCVVIGLEADGETSDRQRLEEQIKRSTEAKIEPLWLVLIGHGTFDGKTAKFNLRGPDVTAADLNGWLKAIDRPVAVIDCSSSSGPFVVDLSGPNRVVVTATKSGHEYNYSRFGDHLSAAIASQEADLDKDDQTSLLEAFLLASAKVREFYATETRLATEHAILDDNGDRLGTPADWFVGLRPVKAAQGEVALDGNAARQFILLRNDFESRLPSEIRVRRDALERDLAALRDRKPQLPEAEYFALLEPLLLDIARLYAQFESSVEETRPEPQRDAKQ